MAEEENHEKFDIDELSQNMEVHYKKYE